MYNILTFQMLLVKKFKLYVRLMVVASVVSTVWRSAKKAEAFRYGTTGSATKIQKGWPTVWDPREMGSSLKTYQVFLKDFRILPWSLWSGRPLRPIPRNLSFPSQIAELFVSITGISISKVPNHTHRPAPRPPVLTTGIKEPWNQEVESHILLADFQWTTRHLLVQGWPHM